jgi:hypothetical protein
LCREGAVLDEVKQVLGIQRAEFSCIVPILSDVSEETQRAELDEKYLGLLMPAGREERGRFQTMEERYVKRMVDWRVSGCQGSFNQGGRPGSTNICDVYFQDSLWIM